MLVVISPAKRLDWTEVKGVKSTQPAFQHEANILAGHARQLTLEKLKGLMGISDDLARMNRDRFRAFQDAPDENTKAAALAFAGDTYMGLEAGTLEADALSYAQDHLRILSGLYGVLRPLDAIQPYRLEMGSRLKTRRGASLYDFWRDIPARALNDAADATESGLLINCASQEYFGAVDLSVLKPKVVTPVFMEVKDGTPRIVSFFAKKARGAMARFIVEHRVKTVDGLRDFDTGGYTFDPGSCSRDRLVFLRDAVTP